MKYEVIARKFRPQIFEEVVGQNPIVQTLKNAIEMDRIGHAYLFCGPRGVGKTTMARLLAKALNCSKGPTGTPCNKCDSCLEIARGHSLDVLEIDAASNTGVDSIRELRENARYTPSRDRFKIFIVDEVHMLSTSAFNALLKILEEPPRHVEFIMATTERHKLPPTILSRCQQFVFRTIPPAEIQEHLRKIAQSENINIGNGALDYVVRAAEGSMRDAQSLLDQVIAFGGQDIADEDVRDVLGFIPVDLLDNAVSALISRDSRILLEVIEVVVEQGLNLQQFVGEFLSRIRDLLLTKLELSEKILGGSGDRAKIAVQAEQFSEQDLIRFAEVLLQLARDLRFTSEPRFCLEVGSVKLTKIGHLRDIEEVIRNLKNDMPNDRGKNVPIERPVSQNAGRGATAGAKARTAKPQAKPTPRPTLKIDPPQDRPAKADPEPNLENRPKPDAQKDLASPGLSPPPQFDLVEEYKREVGGLSAATALYLERAEVSQPGKDTLEIRVPSRSVQTALEGGDHRKVLETAAAELLSHPIAVSLSVKPGSREVRSADHGSSLRESAEKEVLVQSFLNVFRGEIAHVKDAKNAKEGSQS